MVIKKLSALTKRMIQILAEEIKLFFRASTSSAAYEAMEQRFATGVPTKDLKSQTKQ